LLQVSFVTGEPAFWNSLPRALDNSAPDLGGGGPGPRRGGRSMRESDIETLGKGWPMKSLVFPRIIYIYDVTL